MNDEESKLPRIHRRGDDGDRRWSVPEPLDSNEPTPEDSHSRPRRSKTPDPHHRPNPAPPADPERKPRRTGPEGTGDRRPRTRPSEDHERPRTTRAPNNAVKPQIRTLGPIVIATGRVVKQPESREVARPSWTPAFLGLLLVAVASCLPIIVTALPIAVFILLLYIWLSRKFQFRVPSPRRRRATGEPGRALVSTFRIAIASPADPAVSFKELSCRLVTLPSRGALALSGGDKVKLRGTLTLGRQIGVRSVQVLGTSQVTRHNPLLSRSSVWGVTLILLVIAAGLLWAQRDWFSMETLNYLEASFTQILVLLLVLALTLLGIRFIFKGAFRR